jgi:hypothetical protein
MSQLIESDDPCLKGKVTFESSCQFVRKLIKPRTKDLGGFKVRRILPTQNQKMIGPWVFFDHMGPADFKAGEGINVRPHPHINLATVTYTFEGEIWHRDSLGNSEPILPGELNLMVAGRGIVHSERTREELLKSGQKLDGLQLWLALPQDQEEIDPAFYHYAYDQIPQAEVEDIPVRLMIGEAFGLKSPVKQFASTLYFEARLKKGQKLKIPHIEERAVYVVNGKLQIGTEAVEPYHLAVLEEQAEVSIEALEDTFIAVIGGEKLNQRFMEWNFVSSRRDRIELAKRDWSDGKFPSVPGDDKEFIPYP